ncbi:MAG TPA: UDP-N-acetylmuramoyl-tripeptide--D-alanyl-D-alanine ligase [Longimicrobiales bacterium]|nr:UDP-N-acetylmuramoyl-tripeptide--D-alanyl-D-alanine ligase [Longimicrobiales bacterium]
MCTDSRSVEPGELFVALVGERFDGHDFVADPAAAGAAGAVVSRPPDEIEGLRIYPVDDTLQALGRLARFRRRRLSARVVGITGSSGKTTTKDLVRGALEPAYRVHATRGNLNNRIGLPRTVLDAPDETQVLVLEMGTNEPGEIAILTSIAEPGYGVVTTVSETHLEKLESLEGVLAEKLDLLRGLGEPGVGVVSDEPPVLAEAARAASERVRVAGWSRAADPDLRPGSPEADDRGCFRFRWRDETVTLRIPGRHAVQNALLALAVADELEVDASAAARGLGTVEPPSMRGEIRRVGKLTLILDCYNANPQSVRAALEVLGAYPASGPRIAVLGTMLELGGERDRLHREVLSDALARPLDLIVATGAFAEAAREAAAGDEGGPALVAADDPEEAYPLLRERLEGREVVLLKGSRGVALERLLPLLERDFGGNDERPARSVAGEGA